jgi:hypothetical protein
VTDDHRCEPVHDSDGMFLGHAHVSSDLDDRGRAALIELMQAAIRLQAERDAADPEAAAERGRRQAASVARIRERARRLRGESS